MCIIIKFNTVFYALMCKPFLAENGTTFIIVLHIHVLLQGNHMGRGGDTFFIRMSFCGCYQESINKNMQL